MKPKILGEHLSEIGMAALRQSVVRALAIAMGQPRKRGKTVSTTTSTATATHPFSNAITALYFWEKVDFLGTLAHDLALDFYARPQTWKSAGLVAQDLAKLRSKYGSEPEFPSPEQRSGVFGPLFGTDFTNSSQQVMAAASNLVERVHDSGVGALRANFKQAAQDFRDYLSALAGDSVTTSAADLLTFTDVIYKILRDTSVNQVFGKSTGPTVKFPYDSDPLMNQLVADISNAIGSVTYSVAEVMNRQRAASAGARAIDNILKPSPTADKDVDDLASTMYGWVVAVRALNAQPTAAGSRALTAAPPASVSVSPTTRLAIAPYRGGDPFQSVADKGPTVLTIGDGLAFVSDARLVRHHARGLRNGHSQGATADVDTSRPWTAIMRFGVLSLSRLKTGAKQQRLD